MSAAYNRALRDLTSRAASLKAAGGTVACWESVDYLCNGCPLLTSCRAFEAASGERGVRCLAEA